MGATLTRHELLTGDELRARLAENPGKAAGIILRAAGDGIVEAQTLLGQILLDGQGIEKDQVLARRWFAIAAQHDHAMAHNMLGRCQEHGWGGPADCTAAAHSYQRALSSGLDWAMYNYAGLLATGRGVAQDQHQAFDWYLKAANLGHAKSMNLVGRYLEEGIVGAPDLEAAHDWYRRSAEAGDFRGQFSHAAILAGKGQLTDAIDWLKKALTHGNLNFLRASRGSLAQAPYAEIRAVALDYHQRAAELGDDQDQHALDMFCPRHTG